MRWPIQAQLLLPVLSVVVLTIAVASMASGYIGALRARQAEEESLRRVVTTLVAEDRFPLNEWVLQKMSGLSGGEFVFLDTEGHVVAATLALTDADAKELREYKDRVRLLEQENEVLRRAAIYLGRGLNPK